MSVNHHGAFPNHDGSRDEQESPALKELLRRFEQQKQGNAPREYPAGRMGADDDGALVYQVGSDSETNTVRIEFGKPVTWLGMEPQDAMNLAQSLIKHARAIAKTPITIALH